MPFYPSSLCNQISFERSFNVKTYIIVFAKRCRNYLTFAQSTSTRSSSSSSSSKSCPSDIVHEPNEEYLNYSIQDDPLTFK